MIFQRSLIREFSLIAIAVVGVLLALMLTRLLIVLLGKAAIGLLLHPPLPCGGQLGLDALQFLIELRAAQVFGIQLGLSVSEGALPGRGDFVRRGGQCHL